MNVFTEEIGADIDAAELLDRQWEFFCDEAVPFDDEMIVLKGWEDEFQDLGYENIGSADWYEFCNESLEISFAAAQVLGTLIGFAFANYVDGWDRENNLG